jgi:hypothetical protein
MSTSLQVFRGFFTRDDHGRLDVSNITSKACYEEWINTRKSISSPEKVFVRTILSHISAIDGRSPFSEAEERAVLAVLRNEDTVWGCFPDGKLNTKLRIRGFHERDEDRKKRPCLVDQEEDTPETRETPDNARQADAAVSLYRKLFDVMPITSAGSWEKVWEVAHQMALGPLKWVDRPTRDQAEAFQSLLKAELPQHFVLLEDGTETEYSQRFILQDEVALEYFGPMAREFGGTKLGIVGPHDLWSNIVLGAKAHYPVGNRNARGQFPLLMKDGSWKQFDVEYITSSEARLLAMVGKMRVE